MTSSKRINLALQGGGAHGAFTWGVLDRIFEDDRIEIAAISGTSAGAMNAVVCADGLMRDGRDGARAGLDNLWRRMSTSFQYSPVKRTPMDIFMGNWDMTMSPGYHFFDALARMYSPQQRNPMSINPLLEIIQDSVDFERVRSCEIMKIFVSATNVETGRVQVFNGPELTADMVMASSCLPMIFEAVEIDGVPYWDGGYMGNPVLFPFHSETQCSDVVVVQINPVERKGAPTTPQGILNRINEISFNGSLLKELRSIDFVSRLIHEGKLSADDFHDTRVHIIANEIEMKSLGASSKLNVEWAFLTHLRDVGRATADAWLQENFEHLGEKSTVDLRAMFQGTGGRNSG